MIVHMTNEAHWRLFRNNVKVSPTLAFAKNATFSHSENHKKNANHRERLNNIEVNFTEMARHFAKMPMHYN